jgi:DNA polymerase III epsilon subunit family exonuclease
LRIDRACPACRTHGSVEISRHHIHCTHAGCGFDTAYCCPLCDAEVTDDMIVTFDDGSLHLSCGGCRQSIALKKIQYLLSFGMIVDKTHLCQWCNGPTIHRPVDNLSHRCFFYPKCSGQADLFVAKHEEIIFLDFETTGLEPGRDHIIEIGALKMDEEGCDIPFQMFVKPPVPIDERITKITGITDAMVKDAVSIEVAMGKLMAFIGTGKLVAHNAEFDIPWLMTSALSLGLPIHENKVICTLKWARKNGEARASLGTLTKKYSISHHNAHRALSDAASTRELYLIYENTFPQNKIEDSLADYRKRSEEIVSRYLSHR